MVLSKSELIAALQDEVRILLHLASKVDAGKLDYRPTPKQRSTFELLKYLSMMGPVLVAAAKTGAFDEAAWTAAEQAAAAQTFDETIAGIASQKEAYSALLGGVSEDDFRAEIEPFGEKASRGAFIVSAILGGCVAYRTQLFLYLKASGREELGSSNLWSGMDAPEKA
ncbi:MAG: hypothetical protein JJE39_03735 [Vicinamibacteria bacterium]|nr:hypothetical protein [Vicinamibacteria bacterium]